MSDYTCRPIIDRLLYIIYVLNCYKHNTPFICRYHVISSSLFLFRVMLNSVLDFFFAVLSNGVAAHR